MASMGQAHLRKAPQERCGETQRSRQESPNAVPMHPLAAPRARAEASDPHRRQYEIDPPAKETEELFYDIVLSCRLADLCDDDFSKERGASGCWQYKFIHGPKRSCDLEQWAGYVVGILGQYNKGKTWIMSRLSEYQFPGESKTVRTEGISLKWIETKGETTTGRKLDTYYHLVIDTAGFNIPIALSGVQSANGPAIQRSVPGDTTKTWSGNSADSTDGDDGSQLNEAYKCMRETEHYEQFLQSMTLDLADYLLVVTSETTLSDQRFLFRVVRKWRESNNEKKCKEVFVLHNFRDTKDAEERELLFSQSTENILDGRMVKKMGISYFTCPILQTRHVCLMDDNTDRAYNDAVFDVLKGWIHNILPPPVNPYTPVQLANHFAKCSSRLLSQRGFLLNVKEIQFQETDDGGIYKAVKLDPKAPIVQISSEDDKFYSVLHNFHPSCSVRNYRSKAGSECKLIQIEAPGVPKIKVRQNYKKSNVGHWAVEVSGFKEKDCDVSCLRKNDQISNDTRLVPADEPAVQLEPDADSRRYGKFTEVFQIPLKFQKPKWTMLRPDNGVFSLLFEEEPDIEDDDDDQLDTNA